MARYIDIEGAGIGKANREQFLVPEFADGWNAVLKILEKEPTADVAEVRHGEWLLDGRCSECLENPLTTHRTYCPSCGAKMDKNELLENPEQLDLRPISCGAKMDKGVTE